MTKNLQSNSNWMLNFTYKDLSEAFYERAKHCQKLDDEGVKYDVIVSIAYRDVRTNPVADWIRLTIFKID